MLMERLRDNLLAALLVVALAFGWVQYLRRGRADDRARRAALTVDSLEAAADSTRHVYIQAGVLGESLAVAERRAVQAAQRSDAIDRLLKMERVARARLEARVAGLDAIARSETAVVAGADGVRHATFEVRKAPYTVHASVLMPAPPAVGEMQVSVELDTIALEVRLSCGVRAVDGVRAARASVVSPPWVTVRLARVEQEVRVCSPVAAERAGGWRRVVSGIVGRIGVSAGYGAVRVADGAVVAGPGVMAGIRVWP